MPSDFAGPPALRLGRLGKIIERRGGGCDFGFGHRRITRRGVDAAMAEQHLNDTDVFAIFEQVGGEAMTKRVGRYPLVYSGQLRRFPADLLNSCRRDVPVRLDGGEQPWSLGPLTPPILSQHFQ